MDLKTYKREGIVSAWSNSKVHSELLVCSAPMSHDDTLHDLEIMSVDLADRSKNLTSIGKAYYDTPFRCLAWDTFGEKDGTFGLTQTPTLTASSLVEWRMAHSLCGTPPR